MKERERERGREGAVCWSASSQCSVLLYVIGGDTLSVGSMAEVAYYIGQERKMALVLSDIPTSPHLTTPERDLQVSDLYIADVGVTHVSVDK